MSLTVYNPINTNTADNTTLPNNLSGKQGEQLNADIHGMWYAANLRKNLFTFNVTAVTIPVVASGLVSVFTLWNPPSSNVVAEIISTQIGQVLATTVVDTLGWYYSSGSLALAGTFTTKAVANTNYFSGRIGDTPGGEVIPYTAYTHSGTPVRCDIIAAMGAVTDAGPWTVTEKQHNGRLILPPGVAISVASATAHAETSGTDLQVTWTEWPFA